MLRASSRLDFCFSNFSIISPSALITKSRCCVWSFSVSSFLSFVKTFSSSSKERLSPSFSRLNSSTISKELIEVLSFLVWWRSSVDVPLSFVAFISAHIGERSPRSFVSCRCLKSFTGSWTLAAFSSANSFNTLPNSCCCSFFSFSFSSSCDLWTFLSIPFTCRFIFSFVDLSIFPLVFSSPKRSSTACIWSFKENVGSSGNKMVISCSPFSLLPQILSISTISSLMASFICL